MQTCALGQPELVQQLIDAGANVETRGPIDENCLGHAVVLGGDPETVRLLLAAGVDPNHIDREGYSPLHRAVIGGNSETVKALLVGGAKVDTAPREGWTPLMFAVSADNVEITKALLKAGPDRARRNDEGETALVIAKKSQNQVLIDLLQAP